MVKKQRRLLFYILVITINLWGISKNDGFREKMDSSSVTDVKIMFVGKAASSADRLYAGKILFQIGSNSEKLEVDKFIKSLVDRLEKSIFLLDEKSWLTLEQEGFVNPADFIEELFDIVAEIEDVDLLLRVLKWGGNQVICNSLAEIGTPEAIEGLIKAAENDSSMWSPFYPPTATSREKKLYYKRVSPEVRISAVSALTSSNSDVSKSNLLKLVKEIELDNPNYSSQVGVLKVQILDFDKEEE